MKHTWYLSVTLLATLVVVLTQIGIARADNRDLDFTLANKTGYAIRQIYIAPSTSTDWGDNLLAKPMAEDEQLAITFNAKLSAEEWDIRIVWFNAGGDVVWKKCRLGEISKITLRYNPDTDITSADTE